MRPDGRPLVAVELPVELVLVAVHQAHAPPRLLPAGVHPPPSLTAWQPDRPWKRRETRMRIAQPRTKFAARLLSLRNGVQEEGRKVARPSGRHSFRASTLTFFTVVSS